MSRNVSRRAFLVVALVVVGLLVGGGYWQSQCERAGVGGPGDMVREVGWDALVGSPPEKQYVTWEGFKVTPDMAKCPITSGDYNGSGVIRWTVLPGSDQGGVQTINLSVGGFGVIINYDVTGAVPGYHYYSMAVVDVPPTTPPELILVPTNITEPYHVAIPFSFHGSGAQLEVNHTTTPIGEKGATHAKECTVAEEWVFTDDAEMVLEINGGEFRSSGSGSLGMSFSGSFDPDEWGSIGKYAVSFTDLEFCGQTIDLSKEIPPTIWHVGGNLSEEGTADGTLGLFGDNYQGGPFVFDAWPGHSIVAPYSYDYSNMDVCWMDGTPANAVEVTCTGIRVISTQDDVDEGRAVAVGKDMGPWTGTMDALKGIGRYTQTQGFVTGSVLDPDCQATNQIYMKYSSMREQGFLTHPRPTVKVEGCMFGVTGTEESFTTSPIDGDYWLAGLHNGLNLYSKGDYTIFATDTSGDSWGIGIDQYVPPYYIAEDGGPFNIYFVNDTDYEDAIIDEETGQKRFTGWTGLGPVVSAQPNPVDPDTSTPSFAHDGTLIFNCWPLSATDRTSAPDMSDVVQLTHSDWTGGDPETVDPAGCPLYKDAHDHTDWVGDGCTTPDANGNFTASAGGTLTLSPRSYYITRQAGTYIPLPNRYWIRKADYHYGSYPTEEPLHEAPYDWRGWSYLRNEITLPGDFDATSITVTIKYYMDLAGPSDNHMTGGERDRETEYTYTPGELFTYTREERIVNLDGSRKATFITDLYWAVPVLANVQSIEYTFADAGAYVLHEPALVSDQGDPQTGREVYVHPSLGFANHGGLHKFFESPRYAQGGFSAVYDGIFDRQLYIPDNVKANEIEYCFPTLNVLIGAKSGIDMTTNIALSGVPIGTSCEAWNWSYSLTAENAHMKDADGNVLKTLNCYDIVPVMNSTDLNVAVRCYQISCVRGLPYTFHGTHWVGGAGHGMCKTSGGARKRTFFPYTDIADLCTRADGSEDEDDYTVVEDDVRADEHGHWHDADGTAGGGPATSGNQELYEWAVKGKEYVSLGNFKTREYCAADVVWVGGGELFCTDLFKNAVWLLHYKAGEGIQQIYTSDAAQYFEDGKSKGGFTNPLTIVDDANTDGSATGYFDKRARFWVFHIKDGNLKRLLSTSWGKDWGDEVSVIDNQNISKAVVVNVEGIQYCAAVLTDGSAYCYTSNSNFDEDTYTVGTNKHLITTGCDEMVPSLYFAHGVFVCYVQKDDALVAYRSTDFGKAWTAVSSA